MHYAILCYASEDQYATWSQDQEAHELASLKGVTDKIAQAGKLGPVARLMPTTSAMTLRKGKKAVVLDGPFAETKEQLLGFYIVECDSLDEALDAAKQLGRASESAGSYEIRPIAEFHPGGGVT